MVASLLRFLMILTPLCLTACWMVGPNYKEPEKKVARHWLDTRPNVQETHLKNANWWAVFHDATLTALIHQGYEHNVSIQSAAAHVLQTRAQLAQAVGEWYPQQQALMADLTYNRIGGQSLQFVLPPSFMTSVLGVSASWELDFWGKYRRAILSNDAVFLASFAAYDQVLVTHTADIATTYISIRTTDALIRITKANIQIQRIALQIAQSRFHAGQVSLLDVAQAQTELSETQAGLPVLVSQLQHQKDILGVLLGTTPDAVDAFLVKNHGIPHAPSTAAVGIPKETLLNRPDIYQARFEAIAQSEAIGATKANLFPAVSLAGTFAFGANNIGSASIGDMFNWSNRMITAGPSFSWPLLNYGQITNAVRMQDAAYQQAELHYLDVILHAQQEVQDAITQFVQIKQSERFLFTANQSAIKSMQLAMIRYKEGESDFTPVLDAERQQLRVQRSFIEAQGEVPKALVALYRALGGGWQIRQCNDIVPNRMKQEMVARTNWGSLLEQKNHQPPSSPSQRADDLRLPNW